MLDEHDKNESHSGGVIRQQKRAVIFPSSPWVAGDSAVPRLLAGADGNPGNVTGPMIGNVLILAAAFLFILTVSEQLVRVPIRVEDEPIDLGRR
jgi:hypothetical protein